MSAHKQSLTEYINAFVRELSNSGVENVVISPGSRSTPLAMLIAENKNLKVHIQVDERSAAFFALGIAKATGKPTVILCTSGTAAANYYPAIIEANLSRVPLIVLTADRPHELRNVGAPQAIDQINMYGSHVKSFVEMAIPESTPRLIRYVRSICNRAVSTAASSPAGPVHLNFPLREPLIPQLANKNVEQVRDHKYVNVRVGSLRLAESDYEEIASFLSQFEKGLIICGPMENNHFIDELISLSEKLQFPIVADPLSQLRSGQHCSENIITSYDSFLKDDKVKDYLQPEVVVRFGAMPVSKSILLYLQKFADVAQYVIDNSVEEWRDPALTSTEMIYCDEKEFCESISDRLSKKADDKWLKKWRNVEAVTKATLLEVRQVQEMSESKLIASLTDLLPDEATLFVGNSMPIRDIDTFFHTNNKNIKVMANRGANGIDGVVSTALGVAAKRKDVYLIVGDLTFFHDLNGLLVAKLYDINLKIIVINNNGGGIFSFLPQAEHRENFEQLFGTPLNLDFAHVVKMYDGNYKKVSTWDEFEKELTNMLTLNGLSVIEVTTNRDENLREHRKLWENVSREITLQLGVE